MDLKKSSITADILNLLSDNKVHTLQEIADEIEISKMTVRRHIQSLSYRYPIQTFCGGINRGGVYLDKDYIYQVLQKQNANVDQKLLHSLLNKFSLPSNKESFYEQ